MGPTNYISGGPGKDTWKGNCESYVASVENKDHTSQAII